MDVKNIDEAFNLITKYKAASEAMKSIQAIDCEHVKTEFVLIDKATRTEINLNGMRDDSLEALSGVLRDKMDKILNRIRDL